LSDQKAEVDLASSRLRRNDPSVRDRTLHPNCGFCQDARVQVMRKMMDQ
jgi:hypothetical protein